VRTRIRPRLQSLLHRGWRQVCKPSSKWGATIRAPFYVGRERPRWCRLIVRIFSGADAIELVPHERGRSRLHRMPGSSGLSPGNVP
jgi:hypothetical protein